MEVRKRDGNVLIGHAPDQRDDPLIVRQRMALPFTKMADPRSLDQILAETSVVETFVFETRGAVIFVDDQDPYLIPGFIPCGTALSLAVQTYTVADGAASYEQVRDFVKNSMAQALAEEIVKLDLMAIEEIKSDREALRNHRFSVYVTRGNG